MELRIQYAKRADGARTALGTIGSGPYVVVPPGWVSHLESTQNDPALKTFLERMAEHVTVVLYDRHGCGLSDRDRTDFGLEDDLLDVEAVVEQLALERLSLFGNSGGGPISLLYAARHPEKVTRLAFYGSGAGFTPGEHPRFEASTMALANLVRANWGLASKTLADVFFPSGADQEMLQKHAGFERMAATAEMAAMLLEHEYRTDLRPLLPDITMPALVLHRRGEQAVPFAAGQELAMLLPNARFVPLEGDIHLPAFGDTESVLRPLLEFLAEDEVAKSPAPTLAPRITTPAAGDMYTILFTDMEGSTTLADRLGDAAAQDIRRTHNDIVRGALATNSGSEIKHTGDGIMASFSTASSALDAAIAIQRGVAEHKEEHPASPLGVYVGLNAGEPIAEDDDLFGTSINLAARICDHANAGQIIASDVVRQLAAGKDFLFADLGETELRGFEDPVKLWELRWQQD
jgi:class 3 adenylate cyclase/predicted alpha/beta hydrolase